MLDQIPGESIAECLEPLIGSIGGCALLNRVYARFADVPRSTEIRFANPKGDYVIHGQDKVEEFPYPGWWDLLRTR